jgi:protein involved in sex pheromone biosynthesis
MEKKDIIIITLAILAIYLYLKCHGYLDDYKAHLDSDLKDINENKEIFQELKQQVNHYQTLYQKRVEKDLGSEEIINLKNQKISKLETSLLNLAKQKLKGNKDSEKLLNDLETK